MMNVKELDFGMLFDGGIFQGKQLEMIWFHQGDNESCIPIMSQVNGENQTSTTTSTAPSSSGASSIVLSSSVHPTSNNASTTGVSSSLSSFSCSSSQKIISLPKMPFLRRSLSYIRQVKTSAVATPPPQEGVTRTKSTTIRREHEEDCSSLDKSKASVGGTEHEILRNGNVSEQQEQRVTTSRNTGVFALQEKEDLLKKLFSYPPPTKRQVKGRQCKKRARDKTKSDVEDSLKHVTTFCSPADLIVTVMPNKTPTNELTTGSTTSDNFMDKTQLKNEPLSFEVLSKKKAYYYYLYYGHEDGGRGMKTQVETRLDRRCPLCFFNAATNTGILTHLRTTHSEQFKFDGGVDERGSLHIAIKKITIVSKQKEEQQDSAAEENQQTNDNPEETPKIVPEHLKQYIFITPKKINASGAGPSASAAASRKKNEFEQIPFVRRQTSLQKALLHPESRKRKVRKLSQDLRDQPANASRYHLEAAISEYEQTGADHNPPLRQYYHSKTNIAMAEGEWDFDSDDDPDEEFLHELSEKLMDEFHDVSSKEKIFMNLWNRFIRSHIVVPDKMIPQSCMDFISKYHHDLFRHSLRDQLLLHLYNFWDNSLLSSNHIIKLMEIYDSKTKQQQQQQQGEEHDVKKRPE